MRSYQMSDKVRLGSKVKQDYAPGAMITEETLKDMMMEQRRAFVGGSRDYGREYDDYYQNRRWSVPSKTPTFTPTSTPAQADAAVKRAATTVAKKIVANARARVAQNAAAAGFGGPVRQFLTPSDIQAAPFGGLGAEEELPSPETVDVVTAVREMYGIALDVKPLAEFVGAHPVGAVAILMMVIGAWAGLASFIGAGGVDAIKQLAKKG